MSFGTKYEQFWNFWSEKNDQRTLNVRRVFRIIDCKGLLHEQTHLNSMKIPDNSRLKNPKERREIMGFLEKIMHLKTY